MSSRNGSLKHKSKGLQSAFRNLFTRSSSPHSSRPQLPQLARPQESVPSVIANGTGGSFDRPDELNMSPSSVQRQTTAQSISAPVVIGAEITNPPPTPVQGSTHTSTNPKNEPTVADMVWVGTRTILQALKEASGVCAPLGTAAGILLECFDTIETTAKNRQDYEDLAADLAAMDGTLIRYFSGSASTPTSVSECIFSISKGIEQQAREIKLKQDRGKGRQLVLAKDDEDDVIRRYRRIQWLFRQLEINLNMSAWSIANEDSVRKRLKALDPKLQAAYDSSLSESINRRTCTEGTRKKVLSDFTSWLQDPTSPAICWMNGMAGTGKTTIACTLAEWLEREHLLAASFFCTRTSADCRDVTRIVPTIAYQLARYSIPFRSALCDAPADALEAGSKTISKQFEHLLKDPLLAANARLARMRTSSPECMVVVIDALDECDDQAGVERLLDALFRHAPEIPLKFFVTSRPEPEIYGRMSLHAQGRAAVYLHDVEKSLVRADIELYLTQELASMLLSPPELKQLVDQSGSLFIYAATLVRHIDPLNQRSDPRRNLQSLLRMTPGKVEAHVRLDELYTKVIELALIEASVKEGQKEDIRLVLLTVLYAQEPISIETIATLSNIDEPRRVEYALHSLRSVLHQPGGTGPVSTLHASFADFIFDSNRSGSYCGDTAKHRQLLAMRCFVVMKDQLHFNICHLESSFIPDAEVERIEGRIKDSISPALAYTCRYWASHLALASVSQNLLEPLADFLSTQLLFWMEVMALRRVMIMGIDVFLTAKRLMKNVDTVSSNLVVWLEDALNFVTSYAANMTSQSTPHIYISALPFCPRSSLVHKHYWHRMRGLLELNGCPMERRDTAAQVYWGIGSTVYSVAYSPDGSRVAAGCEDGSISIRTALDGTSLIAPLQGHTKAVWSVAFSPDSKLLASGSYDHTVRVWSVSTGALVAGPFEGHTAWVKSVSFSPDGKRIVSGSDDKTIRVWDAIGGTLLLGPLEGHDGGVNSVSFSPNGSLIASASHDNTIRLWHSHDGSPFGSSFQGHTDEVRSIAFTPDGNRLVSGSADKAVRVWNVFDGLPVGIPFEGHTQTINSVAVSPDGTRVASGSDDGTVRVWKSEDGTLIAGPLSGDGAIVTSVAFPLDGTRVIADSTRGIQVWNVREGLLYPMFSTLKGLFSSGGCAKLPFEGSSILFCSNGTIRTWDLSDGSSTEDPHQAPFDTSGIYDTSPDGSYILGQSEEGKVQIMYTANGSLAAGPFDINRSSLSAFRFCHDSHSVIMGCRDGTLQVQPLSGGKAPVTDFYGHRGKIGSIDQSQDGSLLVSYSDWDGSIRVWNMLAPMLNIHPQLNDPSSPPTDEAGSTVHDGWRVNEDGWVINKHNHLLFWLPSDIAAIRPSPYASFIITKTGMLIIPEQSLLVGGKWSECYIDNQFRRAGPPHS